MSLAEYEAYIASIDIVENRITDDNKLPVVKDNKIKKCCQVSLELLKIGLNYLKVNINASKKTHKKAIPEDYELSDSDEQPKYITLTEEQRLTSKNIIIDCPLCHGKIQLRNEIEINPKTGITCRCNPCSFKLSKNDKTMNVSRDNDGDIVLDCQDHSISFSFNRRQITPESEDEQKKYQMISDVMSTPRNKPSTTMDEMD